MRLLTQAQSQQVDELSVSEWGLTSLQLMENAAQAVVQLIQAQYHHCRSQVNIQIFCGPGNNGADGLAIARLLRKAGYKNVFFTLVLPMSSHNEIWTYQKQQALASGAIEIAKLSENADIYVDAIFGTGQRLPLSNLLQKIIHQINSTKKQIIAVDVPTGLHSDNGTIYGECINATNTITFGLAKPGFFVNQGPTHCGKIRISTIGFPQPLLKKIAATHFLFTKKMAQKLLPQYSVDSHKYHHGQVLIIASSDKYLGAGVLTSRAAFRCGAGLVTLITPMNRKNSAWIKTPEIILKQPQYFSYLLKSGKIFSYTIVIGPGLGVNAFTAQIIKKLKKINHSRVVLDADAITTCQKYQLWPLPPQWILTPHAGELARGLALSSKKIEEQRYHFAMLASHKCGALMLLKGFHTIVASANRSQVIFSGNAALSKAGSGDVLSGMIGAFLAQNLGPVQSASLAAYIHGKIADDWIKQNDQITLMPSDLISRIPQTLRKLRM